MGHHRASRLLLHTALSRCVLFNSDNISTILYPGSSSAALLDLTGHIAQEDNHYSASGGSADIWKGILSSVMGNRKVAIKVVRANGKAENDQEKMNKKLCNEISIWQELDHTNILPLMGITFNFGRDNPLGMVCPWLENGSLNGYLERCGVAFVLSDRLGILYEVAAGLLYLHSRNIVHGDLSGSNILIDSDGKAFLADFGLSSNACGPSYAIPSTGGSVRWAAPEHFRVLYDSCPSTATTHGDIYSYGSVMLQVLSGRLPYHYLRRDTEVLIELYRGVPPARPPEMTDKYWMLICQCWADVPCARPSIGEVSACLQRWHCPIPMDSAHGTSP